MSSNPNPPFLNPPPSILFRILHNGNTGFDPSGNLSARDPNSPITNQILDTHLSWEKENTPFLSFCTFRKASRVVAFSRNRMSLAQDGGQEITLIAIDSSAMTNVLDAYEIAKRLGYRDDDRDPRRRLRYHDGEYLLWGGYAAEEGKLLMQVPVGEGPLRWAREELDDQIYMHTGARDARLVDRLVLAMGVELDSPRRRPVERARLADVLKTMAPIPWPGNTLMPPRR